MPLPLGALFKFGEKVFQFLDTRVKPSNVTFRRSLAKIKYANRAYYYYHQRQLLRKEKPRTQKTIQKIIQHETAEGKAWQAYNRV